MTKNTIEIQAGIDDPLEDLCDDCLNRSVYARRILKIVECIPVNSNIRIGIHGPWGSGKTTTMHFLMKCCENKGYPVALFQPWQFRNREDAWKGFVVSVDNAIAAIKRGKIGPMKVRKILKNISKAAGNLAKITGTPVGQILGQLVLAPLAGLLKATKNLVQKELDKVLKKNQRLFIFIDDLDRSEPKILYDFLMLLNEIIDLRRCVYIIGLDTKNAAAILKNDIGFPDSKEFLEKIINWPFDLPEPSVFDWEYFLEIELKKMQTPIHKEAMESILTYLPKNARKFKHFLRYISGLHKSFLSNYAVDELDWPMLYISQLFKIEFPLVFDKIRNNREILSDLALGMFADLAKEKEEKDEEPKYLKRLKEIAAQIGNIKFERLRELYTAMRQLGGQLTPEQLKNHFLVVEMPELYTQKEYDDLLRQFINKDSDVILERLKKFYDDAHRHRDTARAREFMKMLIRDRDKVLNEIADLKLQDEMVLRIKYVEKITEICFLLLDVEKIFIGKRPLFNLDVFIQWFGSMQSWAGFTNQEVYLEIRKQEKELIIEIAKKMKGQTTSVMDYLLSWRFATREGEKAFAGTKKEIIKLHYHFIVEEIIERFEKPGGFKELQTDNSFLAEKRLLLTLHPLFHNKKIHERLKQLSVEASKHPIIRKNFLEYLLMLFYTTLGSSRWEKHTDTLDVFRKSEIINTVWETAMSQPLNVRHVGSIREYRTAIQKALGDEEVLPTPQWWENFTK